MVLAWLQTMGVHRLRGQMLSLTWVSIPAPLLPELCELRKAS